MLKIITASLFLLFLPILKSNKLWLISSTSLFILTILSFINIIPYRPNPILTNNSIFSDNLSFPLIILTLWISGLIITARFNTLIKNKSPFIFIFFILLLNLILLFTFSQTNILSFYICFEASLIPTLLLILGWGYQPERLKASFYLIIYTVAASLPLLLSLLFIFSKNNSLSFLLFKWSLPSLFNSFFWIFILLAFLVKIPIYLTHLWLPKAHVEAPVAGSIILAAILLKLGSYGLLRISTIFPFLTKSLAEPITAISLWGAVITRIICIRQPDIKSLIAYSSVGHIGLLTAGIITVQIWGWEGAIIIIIAHGFCSSAIFALANCLYETTSTRSLFLTKGILAIFPIFALFFFIFRAANIAAPPSLNLASEIILLTSILSLTPFTSLLIATTRFLAAVYSLYLYTARHHGRPSNFINPLSLFTTRNYTICILHFIPLFFLILKPDIIFNWLI